MSQSRAEERLRILVTAGPTRERIDPVRYLSNRSSGRMGYAIAEAAVELGHEVVLVSGPTARAVPDGVDYVGVESAEDMYQAVERRIGRMEVCIMAAAVSDYRPARPAGQKIKKLRDTLTLELVKTPDILGSARGPMRFSGLLVGFAAETENVAFHAREKLVRKDCDLVAANDVSRSDIGFDAPRNELLLLFRDGREQLLECDAKEHLARRLVAICLAEYRAKVARTEANRGPTE